MVDVYQRSKEKYKELIRIAEKVCPEIVEVDLLFQDETKLKRVAGIANFDKKVIVLNTYFLKQNEWHMLNDTLPHEISHHIQKINYPEAKQSHGPEWRSVMRNVFGVEPSTYHSYNVTELKRKATKHLYACVCDDTPNIWVSTTIHNRVLKGQCRFCNHCKEVIVYTGIKEKR